MDDALLYLAGFVSVGTSVVLMLVAGTPRDRVDLTVRRPGSTEPTMQPTTLPLSQPASASQRDRRAA